MDDVGADLAGGALDELLDLGEVVVDQPVASVMFGRVAACVTHRDVAGDGLRVTAGEHGCARGTW